MNILKCSQRLGFTLMEMMVTLVIVSVAVLLITDFFIEESRLSLRIGDHSELNGKVRLLTQRFAADAAKAQAVLVYPDFDPSVNKEDPLTNTWYAAAPKNTSGAVAQVNPGQRGNVVVFVQKESVPPKDAPEAPKAKYTLVMYFLEYSNNPKETKKKIYRWTLETNEMEAPVFDWNFLLEYFLFIKTGDFIASTRTPSNAPALLTLECHVQDITDQAIPPFLYHSSMRVYVQGKLISTRGNQQEECFYQYELVPTGTDAKAALTEETLTS